MALRQAIWVSIYRKEFVRMASTICITDQNGDKIWYLADTKIIHREDGPAIERKSGDRVWYWHGKLHRDGAPAVENADGTLKWYLHGRLHRLDGPAIIYANGAKEWYFNGELHRLGGPAIEHPDGSGVYFVHGKRHRANGPAVFSRSGAGDAWWLEGERVTRETVVEYLEKSIVDAFTGHARKAAIPAPEPARFRPKAGKKCKVI